MASKRVEFEPLDGRESEESRALSATWAATPQDAVRGVLEPPDNSRELTVATYVFPHFNRSQLNDTIYGNGWTEHRLREAAQPWFDGHRQPRQPLLGELDESAPSVMERYVELAADHGIDVFIFDWYWYGKGPALHESLESGFLHARNRDRLKFAVMWTPHDWPIWTPTRSVTGSLMRELAVSGVEAPDDVNQSLAYLISRYLHQPNYWRIDGQPVVVIWELRKLEAAWGAENVARELERLREFARSLGHPGIHFHASSCGSPGRIADFEAAGYDSYGHYNSNLGVVDRVASGASTATLAACAEVAEEHLWPEEAAQSDLPYVTNVGVGWDLTPRNLRPDIWPPPPGWPGLPVVIEADPGPFSDYVIRARRFIDGDPANARVLTIGCWNEWTEGHYLLPDTTHGFGMLEALKYALQR